jgi:hypothetical protein
MCIASQILEDMLGTAEACPGIDHPSQSLELSQESIECLRLLPRSELATKSELVSAVGAAEQRQELASKHLGEDCAGQEESPMAGRDPTGVIRSDATGGNQAVQVRRRAHLLIPSVQRRQEVDLGSDAALIGGQGEQGGSVASFEMGRESLRRCRSRNLKRPLRRLR